MPVLWQLLRVRRLPRRVSGGRGDQAGRRSSLPVRLRPLHRLRGVLRAVPGALDRDVPGARLMRATIDGNEAAASVAYRVDRLRAHLQPRGDMGVLDAEASAALSSSLDYLATLPRMPRVENGMFVVSSMADVGAEPWRQPRRSAGGLSSPVRAPRPCAGPPSRARCRSAARWTRQPRRRPRPAPQRSRRPPPPAPRRRGGPGRLGGQRAGAFEDLAGRLRDSMVVPNSVALLRGNEGHRDLHQSEADRAVPDRLGHGYPLPARVRGRRLVQRLERHPVYVARHGWRPGTRIRGRG